MARLRDVKVYTYSGWRLRAYLRGAVALEAATVIARRRLAEWEAGSR